MAEAKGLEATNQERASRPESLRPSGERRDRREWRPTFDSFDFGLGGLAVRLGGKYVGDWNILGARSGWLESGGHDTFGDWSCGRRGSPLVRRMEDWEKLITPRRARLLHGFAAAYVVLGCLITACTLVIALGFTSRHDQFRGYLLVSGLVFGVGLTLGGIYIWRWASQRKSDEPDKLV
jgi:hypothetical protein